MSGLYVLSLCLFLVSFIFISKQSCECTHLSIFSQNRTVNDLGTKSATAAMCKQLLDRLGLMEAAYLRGRGWKQRNSLTTVCDKEIHLNKK